MVMASPTITAKSLIMLAIVALVCAVDQTAKAFALSHFSTDSPTHVAGPLYFTKLVDHASSISYLPQYSWPLETLRLTLIIALAALGIASALTRVRILCAVVIGGIVGNTLDRWTHPVFSVVDFIKVGNLAVFNVADVATAVGIVGLAVCFVPFVTRPLDVIRQPKSPEPQALGV
jgi:lipoprotein signal peptidase